MSAIPSVSGAVLFSSGRSLLFVHQPLAEQTPQTTRLGALQRDPDACVSIADLASRVPRNVWNSVVKPFGTVHFGWSA